MEVTARYEIQKVLGFCSTKKLGEMLGWFGIWHAGRWCKASENRGECLTWLFESIAKQGCEDANYLWDPDLNKEHEELRAFINKELVMVPDGGKHEMHPV